MKDDEEKDNPAGGEGVLSAISLPERLIQPIGTLVIHLARVEVTIAFYMGRPVAVVRAAIRLQVEGGENQMSEDLKNRLFEVRLGAARRQIDGLLGYLINDDYTRFKAKSILFWS